MKARHLVLLTFLVVLGCSGATSGVGTGTTTSTHAPGPTTTTTAPPTTARTITDQQQGQTITLRSGEQLRVVLSSTYWQFEPPTNPAVLRMDEPPEVAPKPAGCVPGEGCGTVTAIYSTSTTGSSEIVATRTSCGEAMGCTGATGRFAVHVLVDR